MKPIWSRWRPELRKLLNEEDFQIRHATIQLLARIQYGKGEVLLQAFDAEPSMPAVPRSRQHLLCTWPRQSSNEP